MKLETRLILVYFITHLTHTNRDRKKVNTSVFVGSSPGILGPIPIDNVSARAKNEAIDDLTVRITLKIKNAAAADFPPAKFGFSGVLVVVFVVVAAAGVLYTLSNSCCSICTYLLTSCNVGKLVSMS